MKSVLKSAFSSSLAVLLLSGNCWPAFSQVRSELPSSTTGSTAPNPAIDPAAGLAPFGLTNPPGNASLDQLYPEPKGGAPFSSSVPDMALSGSDLDKARSISLGQINMSELLPIGRGKL
ncbi:MAG: hypothetical protein WCT03_27255, partial [Candidatus Obscuribacterales bacterium]